MSKADLHLHTRFSDGLNHPRDVVQAAKKAGLQIIAITDHDTQEGAIRAQEYSKSRPDLGVEVIVGEEISSSNGHVIGLFLKKFIPPRLSAARTVQLIHEQGGIAVLPHPFHPYVGKMGKNARAVEMIDSIPFDGIETLNQGEFFGTPFNLKAEKVCKEHGMACIGSSDAHDIHFIGMACTEFPGKTGEDLRRALLERRTQAVCSRNWNVKEVFRHLKVAAPILSRYSKVTAALS